MAIASLILSCLSIILGPFGSVPGIICGHAARARIRRNSELSGDGLAVAGLVIGYVFLSLMIVMVVFYLNIHAIPTPK
jgi:hypothetical protein